MPASAVDTPALADEERPGSRRCAGRSHTLSAPPRIDRLTMEPFRYAARTVERDDGGFMKLPKCALPLLGLLLVSVSSSHDDTIGARFVQTDGANATDCLDHDVPCQSIQFALERAQRGDTVKVAAGIYDVSNLVPESFLFGTTHAQGGYSPDDHFHHQDPDENLTILVGIDAKYRQAMGRLGFKWSPDMASARSGIIDDSPAQALQATQAAEANCVQALAGQFPCRNVSFLSQIALASFSSRPTSAANLWGLVDLNDNREYAIIGLRNGTAIVEVTNPASPREVITIAGNASAWREVKVYQVRDNAANRWRAYAYITTEAAGSGLQVIDLSGLPNTASLATTITDTGSQHTAYVSNIDYSTNVALPGAQAFLYVAGANLSAGSWRVYSLANPAAPALVSTPPLGTQYMHDSTSLFITDSRTAQCDQGHNPCEVLVDFNENTVDLWDITNKASPVRLSSTTYANAQYTHSGWPSADQRHLFFHDELEEIRQGLNTRIYTMDLANLRAPSIVTSFTGPNTTTDHNGYTKGNRYFVSHYRRGLVIFDVTTPTQLREIGSFDTFITPTANTAGTDGAWGVYPFLPSGNVVISDITNGLFVLRDNTATLSANTGAVGFVGTTLEASESSGTAAVRLQRTGGYLGAVSIQYATADGTATAGSDYTAASGTLNWADGDLADKTINIALSNDTQVESAETIRVQLSNPGGGATVDGSMTLDVTVQSEDSAAPPPSSDGGGGGGAMDILTLVTALLVALLKALSAVLRRGRHARMDSPGQV
jgi:choice-of-anchor B domain-containing protein